jgi:hypothetical protein
MAEQNPAAVPPRHGKALETIALAEDQHIADLVAALSEAAPSLVNSVLAERVNQAVPGLDDSDAANIIDAILSLMATERSQALARDAIAGAVAQSSSLAIPDDLRERFASRLTELLAVPTLRIALKAHDLGTEHAHVFAQARAFTDVRPVFDDDPSAPPKGAVIVDTLKIEYFDERLSRTAFFVALDHLDLTHLREVIDRALAKTASLRQHVGPTGMPLWEYEEEHRDARAD